MRIANFDFRMLDCEFLCLVRTLLNEQDSPADKFILRIPKFAIRNPQFAIRYSFD
jgi:hypothetical protein